MTFLKNPRDLISDRTSSGKAALNEYISVMEFTEWAQERF